MQELIKIETNDKGTKVVSAKELYEFLGYDKSQWKRWAKKNIEENQFAFENQDWKGFDIMSSSNNGISTKDYALTIDFAKRLAMMARTEKGEQARQYFISCEKKLYELSKPKEFTTKELLLLQLETIERAEKAERTVAILTHVNKTFTTTEISKELGFKSASELNQKLFELKIQFKQNGTWVLYSKYANLAYVEIKQEVLDSGRIVYYTRWTGLGREFLISKLGIS